MPFDLSIYFPYVLKIYLMMLFVGKWLFCYVFAFFLCFLVCAAIYLSINRKVCKPARDERGHLEWWAGPYYLLVKHLEVIYNGFCKDIMRSNISLYEQKVLLAENVIALCMKFSPTDTSIYKENQDVKLSKLGYLWISHLYLFLFPVCLAICASIS